MGTIAPVSFGLPGEADALQLADDEKKNRNAQGASPTGLTLGAGSGGGGPGVDAVG